MDDNLRWAILKKVVIRILETCDQTQLAEIMVKYTLVFEKILQRNIVELRDQPLDQYFLVKEK